ncbi:MAG: MFS transporter [Aquisalimonadaceae bacterium]
MQYRNIALLALCQAVMMTGTSVLIATSALVGRILSDDPSLATVPMGLQFLAMTLVTIPASLFMKRYGRRAGFLVGIALGLTGTLLAAYAVMTDRFLLFCIAAMLLGAFNGTGQFYRFAAADVADGGRKAQAISLVLAGGIVAGFLGPNLASWTRTLLEIEFAGIFLVLGLMYLIGVASISLLRIPLPPREVRAATGRTLGQIARQPRFMIAVLTAAVGYGTMNVLMVATPLSMHSHNHAFSDMAFVIQWHVLAMFVPSFFTGNLIRRFGLLGIMTTGVLLMVLCVAINWSGTSVWHYWAGLLTLGIGWNFMFIGGTTLLTETYTESEKAKAQACNDFIVFGTVTVTALSSGALLHGMGWTTLNFAVLPFLALVLAGLLWVRRGGGRQGEPAEHPVTDGGAPEQAG